ncbi:F-box protein CPR1-like [Corylus avellana]|uniref:F-box protein CPR1-like n=1 Tax=Corylus avellana TaxID=13451 RepID=UPI00286B77F6|nr:F-box protein CPR1-like [Corylus avellana]
MVWILAFTCVSKSWFVLINDPDFIEIHLNRSIKTNRERALISEAHKGLTPQTYYSVNFSDKKRSSKPVEIYRPFNHPGEMFNKIVGHCNGLVCLHICSFCCSFEEINKYPNYEIVIWNPLIRKYKKLPFKPIENPDDYVLKVAFGYDQINDDYKVVWILKPRPRLASDLASVAEVGHHVYSLRGNSWRMVEDKWPHKDLYLHMHCSASLNGALHWVAGRSGLTSAIVALDLNTEKFRMHAEYGVAASNWTWLYRLPHSPQQTPSYSKPLALSNNGEEVLMHEYSGKLYWYNIKKKRSRIVEIQKRKRIEESELNFVVVGSLLLLDGELDH